LILLILIVVILVVVLPVFLVALPKMIQDKINESELSIDSLSVTQTQTNSVYTEINSTIKSSSSIHATIDGFNASLYLEDKLPHTPFAFIQMPETTAQPVTLVSIKQTLQITNMEAYTDYNTWFMLNDTFRMTVSGETYVRVKGLKAQRVDFLKTVTLKGLNGFSGLEITSSHTSLLPDARGDNFKGFINIPNPTILTVEIGNTTFKNLLNGTQIGTSYIDNMFLYPGNNNLSMRANISQVPIIDAVTTEPYCHTGIIPLVMVGQSAINNGQELGYFEEGLVENKLTLPVNAGANIAEIYGGTSFGCIKPAPATSAPASSSTSAA